MQWKYFAFTKTKYLNIQIYINYKCADDYYIQNICTEEIFKIAIAIFQL